MPINNDDRIPVLPNGKTSIFEADGFVHVIGLSVHQAVELNKPAGTYNKVMAVYATEGVTPPIGLRVYGDTSNQLYELVTATYTNIPEVDNNINWKKINPDTPLPIVASFQTPVLDTNIPSEKLVADQLSLKFNRNNVVPAVTAAGTAIQVPNVPAVKAYADTKIAKADITDPTLTGTGSATNVPSTKATIDYANKKVSNTWLTGAAKDTTAPSQSLTQTYTNDQIAANVTTVFTGTMSDTKTPSQKSVKDYVDAQVSAAKPTVLTAWNAVPSTTDLVSEKLVKEYIDTKDNPKPLVLAHRGL